MKEKSCEQQLAWELLNDPRVIELLLWGAAGGGKSLLIGLWPVINCRMYPGIRIGLGRNEISNLRKTTGQTLLAEVHPMLGVTDGDFRYSSMVDPGIYYKNGSQILFIDLAPAPRDPNFDRLGSLNLTHNIIEEAGEVLLQARSVLASRKNRYLNKKYGITGKTILTWNPSENFTRTGRRVFTALTFANYRFRDGGGFLPCGNLDRLPSFDEPQTIRDASQAPSCWAKGFPQRHREVLRRLHAV